MWRWTRKLQRRGDITDDQAQNILHNIRENPATDDEGVFLEELQTAVAMTLTTFGGVTIALDGSGDNMLVEGRLSNIFEWLISNWEQVLEIVLFLITLF
jgi:hypothetical protein